MEMNSFAHNTKYGGKPSVDPWTSLFFTSQIFQQITNATKNNSSKRCEFTLQKNVFKQRDFNKVHAASLYTIDNNYLGIW